MTPITYIKSTITNITYNEATGVPITTNLIINTQDTTLVGIKTFVMQATVVDSATCVGGLNDTSVTFTVNLIC